MAASPGRLGAVLLLVASCWASEKVEHSETRCNASKPLCPLSHSHCDRGHCVCNSGIGNGHLACHEEVHEYCHIVNDPLALTFGHENFDLPLPCRYFVTHVSADKAYNDWFISQCQTQVYAVNGRSKGKFFVIGADIIVEYASMFVGSLKQFHFKISGQVTSGGYKFDLELKEGIADIPPFTKNFDMEDYPYLGESEFKEYPDEKKVRLFIENCGIEVIFRPADPDLGMRQNHMPGLSVSYHTGLFPKGLRWLSEDSTVCLLPDLGKCSTGQVAHRAHLNPSEAFLWRALYAGTPQTVHYHGGTQVCQRVSESVKTCTDNKLHQEAMEMCTFILAYPLFAHCYSDFHREYYSSERIMALFEDCIMGFCHTDKTQCLGVHQQIAVSGCERFAYNGFLFHTCEFPTSR